MKCYEQWKRTKRKCHQIATCPTCKQQIKDFQRICVELDDSMKILRKTFGMLEKQMEKRSQQKQQQQQQQQQIKQRQQRNQIQLRQQQRPQVRHKFPMERHNQLEQQQQQQQQQQQRPQIQQELPRRIQFLQQEPQLRQKLLLQNQTQQQQQSDRYGLNDPQTKQEKKCATSIDIMKRHRMKNPAIRAPQHQQNQHSLRQQQYQDPHVQKEENEQLMTRMNILRIISDVQETVQGSKDSFYNYNERNDANTFNDEQILERVDATSLYIIRNECNRILHHAGCVSRRNSYSSSSSSGSSSTTSNSALNSYCSTSMLSNRTMHCRPSWQGL
jgi:hypothetical protein